MRADRLVAVLLLLQARGRVTAAEVAEELEVSKRTARRDLEALAMSGVPVYSQAGRGGGWMLVGGATTDLTGLTGDEARALLLTVGTTVNASPALRRAVGKLVQALPEPFRAGADRAADVALVDEAAWGRAIRRDDTEHLEPLQQALLDQRQVELGYHGPGRGPTTRVIHPWGLVSKAGIWYLVAGTGAGQRTFRVSRVTGVRLLDEPAQRPADFDLGRVWRSITVRVQEHLHPVVAAGAVERAMLGPLRYALGPRLRVGPARADGRVEVEVAGETVPILAAQLSGFAPALEVEEPAEVRRALLAIGHRLVERYGDG